MSTHKTLHLGPLVLRINWLVALCVLLTVLGLGRLGVWQLGRAAEKVEAQRALDAELRENAPALESLPGYPAPDPAETELANRHVSLSGEYLNERTILISAEFFNSQIGYGVVTPFRLASDGRLVLVSRGWTTGHLAPGTPPFLGEVEGPVEITGQIHLPDARGRQFDSQIDAREWPLAVRSLDFDILSEIFAEPLFPFEIRLTENQTGTLARHWPAVNIDVNQNLFYAVQWFSFALLVLVGALLASSNLWHLLRSDR